jgi:hypothetical protein
MRLQTGTGIRLAIAWGYFSQAAANEILTSLHRLGGRVFGLVRNIGGVRNRVTLGFVNRRSEGRLVDEGLRRQMARRITAERVSGSRSATFFNSSKSSASNRTAKGGYFGFVVAIYCHNPGHLSAVRGSVDRVPRLLFAVSC